MEVSIHSYESEGYTPGNMSKTLLLVVVCLALIGAGCSAAPSAVEPSSQTTTTAVASNDLEVPSSALAYIDLNGGRATVTRASSTLPVEDGLELDEGDQIHVTSGSVDLIYPDAGKSELEAGTTVTLVPDATADHPGVFTQIQLEAGEVWTRFERALAPDERFSVAASGVVATVRGTAFGVSLDSSNQVDVQVAEHEVQVATEEDDTTSADEASSVVALDAGQGLKTSSDELRHGVATKLQQKIRKLTHAEQVRRGFLFGMTKLELAKLRKPMKIVRLPIKPVLNQKIQQKIQALRLRALRERTAAQTTPPAARVPLRVSIRATSTTPTRLMRPLMRTPLRRVLP